MIDSQEQLVQAAELFRSHYLQEEFEEVEEDDQQHDEEQAAVQAATNFTRAQRTATPWPAGTATVLFRKHTPLHPALVAPVQHLSSDNAAPAATANNMASLGQTAQGLYGNSHAHDNGNSAANGSGALHISGGLTPPVLQPGKLEIALSTAERALQKPNLIGRIRKAMQRPSTGRASWGAQFRYGWCPGWQDVSSLKNLL